MRVRYRHEYMMGGTKVASNILWDGRWPMDAGDFPPDHPCVVQAKQFQEFKQRGYWANPFPEGDGITLDPQKGQSADQVIRDIRQCLGWEVA